jgi:alkylation response protein AidB-like acyl-CoA dehydrogenase
MAATESLDVVLDAVAVPGERAVGEPGFYVARRGFWHGAVGVAACWYGGALGAYRMLRAHLQRVDAGDHQVAHFGAVAASCDAMWACLEHAARRIDRGELQRTHALVVRHVVEQGCQEVLLRVGRASGTTPLTFDRAHARRAADLPVYLRQHHAERDLAALGRALLAPV